MALGDELLSACQSAKTEVVLAAPFIKLRALQRLISVIAPQVPVTVIVRFLPTDLAAGVTDFEIVEYLRKRENTQLRGHSVIHAKLYRIDDRVMIGSANLSDRALGWHYKPNLELLLEVHSGNAIVREIEKRILRTSYPLTAEIASAVFAAAQRLSPPASPEGTETAEAAGNERLWIPACMRPQILWEVQKHGDFAGATRRVVEAAKRDLAYLSIPDGLDKSSFEDVAQGIFKSSPFYELLATALVGAGLTDQEGAAWLDRECGSHLDESAADTWVTVKNWLRHFATDATYISAFSERTTLSRVIG